MQSLLSDARTLLRDIWLPNEEDAMAARVLAARIDAALTEPLDSIGASVAAAAFNAAGRPHECATCALTNPTCYAMVGVCFGDKWRSRYESSSPLPVAQGCAAGGAATKGAAS